MRMLWCIGRCMLLPEQQLDIKNDRQLFAYMDKPWQSPLPRSPTSPARLPFPFFLFLPLLRAKSRAVLQAAPARNADTVQSSIVTEPADLFAGALVDQATRQRTALLGLENLLHNVLFAGAGGDKGNLGAVHDDGQAEGDALRWGLGRVGNAQAPGVRLAQQGVLGEERAGVAVGAAAQQDEVKQRQLDRVAGGKGGDEELFVLVGAFLGVVEVLLVNGVDFGLAQLLRGDLGQQLVLEQLVVAVLVVQRHAALVGKEYLPLAEVGRVGGAAVALGQQGLRQRFGQRATRHGHAEGRMPLNGAVLLGEHVLAECGCELGHRREAVDVGWLAHGEG